MKSVLSGVLVISVSGLAIAAEVEPIKVDPVQGNLKHVAHIYYNIVTGEKITTLIGDQDAQRGVDGVLSEEIWAQTTSAMCSDFGDTDTFFYPMDDPSDTSTLRNYLFDWGGIPMDTVVDCVQINWLTNHQDSDLDSDGNADGVVGFGGSWTYWDAFNPSVSIPTAECISLPIITLNFYNLPGELSDPLDQNLAFYTADIDLGVVGPDGGSLTFEIGDTDSDLQGAAVHNANLDESYNGLPGLPDIDHDQDGFADWGWSLIFSQPGTIDVDNADGDNDTRTGVDGDPLALAMTGVKIAAPSPGHAEYDSITNNWEWVSADPTAGNTDDQFVTARLIGSSLITEGPWFFGGLDCTPDEPGYVPAAMFQTVLYGPSGIIIDCFTDLNGDGEVDFFDISFFLNNQVDYNGDTAFDFFDISSFLMDFNAGCP